MYSCFSKVSVKPKGGETRPVANGLFYPIMDNAIGVILVVVFFVVCLFSKDLEDDFGGY